MAVPQQCVAQLRNSLDAPTMVLDLDSFVEAVTACVQDPTVRSPSKPAVRSSAEEQPLDAPVGVSVDLARDSSTSVATTEDTMESASHAFKKLSLAPAALAIFAA